MKAFKIAPGRYVIPNVGSVDAQKEVSDNKLFEIYKLPRRVFPWIQLGPDALEYLQTKKLHYKEVAKLILNAKTLQEVETLMKLSDTKTVARVAETKSKSLENSLKN
ncbi:hypothetical protein [Zunongwangia profunda]|uniref:hypothetical protein n=1 Tax=Zunongwangia profunda TaxID=398743 RepID=UPI001D17DC2A|nr:hypothetical protein [Zunongwangia profunda]MCC4228388.1 hypothetical protein [Zunongwangia profunda]